MPDSALPYDVVIERLGVLANQSLGLWALPEGAAARLINVSENATYLVETPGGYRSILRVHREDYHTRNAIGCEHAWSKALDEKGGVHTPDVIPGRDGSTIQTGSVDGLPGERHMAMFEFVEGEHPDEDADHLVESFEELIQIGRRSGVRIHFSHFKASGRRNWGKARVAAALVEKATRKLVIRPCRKLIFVAVLCAASTVLADQSYDVEGLDKPAEIIVDEWGVPHIYAQSQYDAFFVQGFNAARDRLWQIDLWRRRGLGLLSEAFGERYIDQDRANRGKRNQDYGNMHY